ncbi:MAG: hypothetical protein ACO2PN_16280 [Pyrobaculum sp.]|jgi:hypothetical protein
MILEALSALRRGAVREVIEVMEKWRLDEPLKWKKVAERLSWLDVTRSHTIAEAHAACVRSWKKLRICACNGEGCNQQLADLVVEVFRPVCGRVAMPRYEIETLCAMFIVKVADRVNMEVA